MSDDASDASPAEQTADAVLPAGLVLVSTPIGNLGDLSARGRDALAQANLVLCEDTRRTARLMRAFGVRTPLLALHEHNEDERIPSALARVRSGGRVVLVSDAGTPLVSDPGYRLTRAAIAEGLPVTAIPGPNAALTALVLSGLPPLPFLVLGFPPPRGAARRASFAALRTAEQAGLSATLIWYEAPHRLPETLADMEACFGDRPAALARELTKRFEEVRRGSLPALAAHFAAEPARGETTIVLGPAAPEPVPTAGLDERLRSVLATRSVRDAVAIVTAATGLPRKIVYARALELAAQSLP